MKNLLIKEHINICNFFLFLILRVRGNLNNFDFLNNRTYEVEEKIYEWEPSYNTVGLVNYETIFTFLILFDFQPIIEILRRQAYAELEFVWVAELEKRLILRS